MMTSDDSLDARYRSVLNLWKDSRSNIMSP